MKRYAQLLAIMHHREDRDGSQVLPLKEGLPFAHGYEEWPDCNLAVLHYRVQGDKSARAVDCQLEPVIKSNVVLFNRGKR